MSSSQIHPVQADEMKVIQQATEAGVSFHDRYRRKYPMKVRPGSLWFVGMCLSDLQVLVPYITTKTVINGLRLTPFVASLPSNYCRIHSS